MTQTEQTAQNQTAQDSTPVLVSLNGHDVPEMIALQNAAGDGMVLARSAGTLTAHFNAGHTAIGVRIGGKLVAQSLVTTAPFGEGISALFMKQSTIGGVIVASEARGKGLMDVMLTAWLNAAQADGIHIAHARVRPENIVSWKTFVKHGLDVAGKAPSPDNPDHDVFFLYKPLHALPLELLAGGEKRTAALPVPAPVLAAV